MELAASGARGQQHQRGVDGRMREGKKARFAVMLGGREVLGQAERECREADTYRWSCVQTRLFTACAAYVRRAVGQ
jgi:hypothetical protein